MVVEAAVVATETVILVAEPPGVRVLGETLQVASDGAPVQVKVTVWLRPARLPTAKVYLAETPGATLAVVVEPVPGVSVKSCPVPLRLTFCVVPATLLLLSVMVRVPFVGPAADGAKVTLIVHEPPAATLLPQLFVWLKLVLAVMLATVSAAVPVLLSVTVCAALVAFTN